MKSSKFGIVVGLAVAMCAVMWSPAYAYDVRITGSRGCSFFNPREVSSDPLIQANQGECVEELTRWANGTHDDDAKNGVYTEGVAGAHFCFICDNGEPTFQVTLTRQDFDNDRGVATEMSMEYRSLTDEMGDLQIADDPNDEMITWDFDPMYSIAEDDSEMFVLDLRARYVNGVLPETLLYGVVIHGDLETTIDEDEPPMESMEPSEEEMLCDSSDYACDYDVPGCQAAGGTGAPVGGAPVGGALLALGFLAAARRRKRRDARGKLFAGLLVFTTLVMIPTMSFAQQDMTVEQAELLNKANAALAQDPADLQVAREAVEAALEAGERYDVLLLTYGRVLQKLDECELAKAAFRDMSVAPHESSVAQADIDRLSTRYTEQMSSMCSALLTLECVDAETALRIDGKDRACGETIKLTPGAYQILATLGSQSKAYDLELEGAQKRSYKISLEHLPGVVKEDAADNSSNEDLGVDLTAPIPEKAPFAYKRTVISGATTAVLAGAAAGVWYWAEGEKYELVEAQPGYDAEDDVIAGPVPRSTVNDIEDLAAIERVAGFSAVGIGVAGLATTVAFAVLDSKGARERAAAPAVSVGVSPGPSGFFGAVSVRW